MTNDNTTEAFERMLDNHKKVCPGGGNGVYLKESEVGTLITCEFCLEPLGLWTAS